MRTEGTPGGRRAVDALAVLGLWALVAVVYAQVLDFGFVNFDDPRYVTQNAQVQSGLSLAGLRWAFAAFHDANYIPLTWLSLMLDVQLFGVSPLALHAVNAVLHALAAALLYLFVRGATLRPGRAAFVAALFAVHPLHVESVAWVSERKDVLSTCLGLGTLLAYLAWVRRPAAGRWALVVATFALGLSAKPMLVTLPVVLLLFDLWPLARLGGGPLTSARLWALVREKWALFVLSAAAGVVTVVAQRHGGSVSGTAAIPVAARLANAVQSYALYLRDAAWPTRLAAVYPHPALTPAGLSPLAVLLSGAALTLLTVIAVRLGRRRPYLAVGWAFYVVTLLPVCGLLQVGLQGRADRYTYLPLLGIFLAATWWVADGLEALRAPRAFGAVLAGLLLAGASTLAHRQVGTWKDSFTLFNHALEVTSDNGLAWRNLGNAWQEARRPDLAVPALQESIRLLPYDARTWLNLAIAHSSQGQLAQADAAFERALGMAPNDPFIWLNLGIAQAMRGNAAGVAQAEARLRELDPDLHAELERRLRRLGARP